MEFDFTGLAIGGVALVYLIPRLVEFAKTLGLSGTRKIWTLAFVLGLFLAGLAGAISENLIPVSVLPWVRVCGLALGGGVAACGAIGDYELVEKRAGR